MAVDSDTVTQDVRDEDLAAEQLSDQQRRDGALAARAI